MIRTFASDRGSIMPLTVFFAFLSLALILVVVAATSLYIERKRLFTLADGAALVGAEAFTIDSVTVSSSGPRPTLQPADVSAAVTAYLASTPDPGFDDLRVDRATTDDGASATVTLSAVWHPPVLAPLVPDGLRIDVTSTARSVFD